MSLYHFTVDGNPVPKARARVILRGGKAHAFTPQRTVAWEQLVRLAYRGEKMRGDVGITMVFRRADARRVDIDNLVKAVLDALNGKAWDDDAQITHLCVDKCVDKEAPGVDVTVSEL